MIGVGDIVVCIDDVCRNADHGRCVPSIKKGSTYRVVDCGYYTDFPHKLHLTLDRQDSAWSAARFRKVLPATPSFTAMIRRLAPKRRGVAA